MSSSLIIPKNINDLSRWEQVFLFHRHGDTVVPLHPPGRGKNGKTPIGSKALKRLNDFDLHQRFKNGADYNIGISPREGDVIVNLDGKDKDRGCVDRFLSNNPALASVPRVQTAAGYHLRFRCDDLPSRVGQAGHYVQHDIAPGVNFELITGEHYVVAPPSLHEQGIPYKWVVTGEVPIWTWAQISTAFDLPEQEPAEAEDNQEQGAAEAEDNQRQIGARALDPPLPDGRLTLDITFTGNSPEIARRVFTRLAKGDTYFVQGGKLVQYNGRSTRAPLSPVSADQFRSHLDRFFSPFKVKRGQPVEVTAAREDAALLLGTDEMKSCLKHVGRVVKHPILVCENGQPRILTTGAHDEIFVDSSDVIPDVPLPEAISALLDLFADFKFSTSSDFSRAMAHLLSPALVFGNLLSDRVPMHVVEADHPGAGKGYLQKLILSIFNEAPGIITNRTRGVGGNDEMLSRMLMSGFAFIQFDNWRGKLSSEMLESALTEDTASCRALHADAIVSTRGAFFMLTSNGVDFTEDLANRCSFVRIVHQGDAYQWRDYDGLGLLSHVTNHRVHYLGCVYSVLSEWIRRGKPQIAGAPHRFWQWAGSMDWIVQHLFGLQPLLEGHKQVQNSVASPILVFLGQAAIKVQQEGRTGEEFTARELIQLAQRHSLTVGGIKDLEDENAHKALGSKLGPCFDQGNALTLDSSFQVVRKDTRVKRKDGNGYDGGKSYAFFYSTVEPGDSRGSFNRGGPKPGCGDSQPDPVSPSLREKGPTTVDTTVEPRLNQNRLQPWYASPSAPEAYRAKTRISTATTVDVAVFSREDSSGGGGDSIRDAGGEIIESSTVVAVVGADVSSSLVPQPDGPGFRLIRKQSDLAAITDTLAGISEPLAIDLETYSDHNRLEDNTSAFKGEIRLLSIKALGFPAWLLDLKEVGYDLGELKGVLENREVIAHNAAFEAKFLKAKCELNLKRLWCTMTAAKLLTNGSTLTNGLDSVVERHLGVKLPEDRSESDWGKDLAEDQYQYAAGDVEHLHALKECLSEELANAELNAVFQQESAVIPIAVDMELAGFQVDRDKLEYLRESAIAQRDALAQELKAELGDISPNSPDENLNLNSPAQLKPALEAAGLTLENTRKDTLAAADHPLADKILKYREATKLLQFIDSGLAESKQDGRIHGQFKPLGTQTGRFSSSNPNMQQIPRGEVRGAFVAAPGGKLVIADYSQIELRAAAFFSQDKEMLQAFRAGQDLHKKTAAVVRGKDPDQVTKEDRQLAKALNFGLLYGMGADRLVTYAKTGYGLNLQSAEAQDLRNAFFAHYTGLARWHDEAWNAARNDEIVEGRTSSGRRRLLLPEHEEWHRFQVQTNLVVQGSCADILKDALIDLAVFLPQGSKQIAVVHDEIIVEAPEAMAEHVSIVLEHVMKKAAKAVLKGVPVEVEAKICSNWGEK